MDSSDPSINEGRSRSDHEHVRYGLDCQHHLSGLYGRQHLRRANHGRTRKADSAHVYGSIFDSWVYCSEVPEARLRGSLGLIPSLFLTFGVVLSYIAGAFFSWRISCYVCSVPIILMFIVLWTVPESPYWYLLKGRHEDCKASLRWLRGPRYDFSAELAEMEEKINSVGRKVEYRELWRPRTRKPFLISLFMSTLQQVSGGNILMMFTGLIFISAGVENHRMATVVTGLVQIVFTLLCMFTADRLGRRPLIIASTLIIGVATLLLGVYYLMSDVFEIKWPPWVPLLSVLTAVAGYCLGCRTMPWLLSAELFNTTIRSTANTATLFYNRLLSVAILQIYPFYEEAFGAHTVFFTFGGLSLICSLVSFFVVPETKGKTLEQIQEHFESTKKKKMKHNIIHPASEVNTATSV
ncbi:facilitated trehalose transporter Tret1-like isoform X2 [Palaemon carinicauda]|uniref:facilitated trehalose transporter Tret1-like isoform X2 n=1 Tax=Palaemon carinicauda TaxID=392227 RepID=UPI0035B5E868